MALSLTQPPGARSRRGEEARRLLDIQHWFRQYFLLLGGEQVIPSTLVSYRAGSGWLEAGDDQRIRLIDRSTGDVVSLRADLTTQLMHMAGGQGAQTLFALAPVFRENPDDSDRPREFWQGSVEFLCVDQWPSGDFRSLDPVQFALLAACQAASWLLGNDWTMVLGSVDKQRIEAKMIGSLRSSESDAGTSAWYSHLREGSSESILGYVQGAGVMGSAAYYDEVLPVARTYYNGWYFRIFGKDGTDPVLFGGAYRDPQHAQNHVGFGADLEALASAENRPLPALPVVDYKKTVTVCGNPAGAEIAACWSAGIRTVVDSSTLLNCTDSEWELCRGSDRAVVAGQSIPDKIESLLSMLEA